MARLLPYIKQQFFDDDGKPLAGGKVFSYAAGTSTPLATYVDAGETAENTNPIVLDSDGEASIWLAETYYKFVICDPNGVVLRTVDNVTASSEDSADAAASAAAAAASAAAAANSAADAANVSASLIGVHAASNNTHGVTGEIVGTENAQTIKNKVYDGGTAANVSRMTIPKNTKTNLDGLARVAGTILYASDEGKIYYDNGSLLLALESSASATYIPVTYRTYKSAGSYTYNLEYAFFSSSAVSATVGATYMHNSVTYTVVRTTASGTYVIMSGSAAPLVSGTLTKASGTGDSSIAFTNFRKPKMLRNSLIGAGGGGGAGTGGANGVAGTATTMNGVSAGGGAGGQSSAGLAGGSGTVTGNVANLTERATPGNEGASAGASVGAMGGPGWGGQGRPGRAGVGDYGSNSANGTGAGGAGGATTNAGYGGGGGGSGASYDGIIPDPAATYAIVVGTAGTGGAGAGSGTSGTRGGDGAAVVAAIWQ